MGEYTEAYWAIMEAMAHRIQTRIAHRETLLHLLSIMSDLTKKYAEPDDARERALRN